MAGAEPVGGDDGDLVRLGYGACGRGVARMIRRLTGFQVAVLTKGIVDAEIISSAMFSTLEINRKVV